jgi:hypothetical protein
MEDLFGEVIYSYMRKQAIEDGVLIDVSELARETGIKYPVAVTSTVYYEYIVPDDQLIKDGQSVEGRLWDVLWMLRINAQKNASAIMLFSVLFVMPSGNNTQMAKVELKAVCGPGDMGEPVITIMRPDED